MVTNKNLLHELLQQDQEPFHLNNYISSHLSNLNATSIKSIKTEPIIQTRNFCINHVCFYSFNDSPDVRKSPFLDIQSPFSKTPSKTKAMLLDAAMRIQKNKKTTYKPKPESPISSFGLFRSILKKLKGRKARIKRQGLVSTSLECRVQMMNDNETSCTKLDDLSNEIKSCWENDEFTCPLSPFRFSLEKSHDSCPRTPDFLSPATSPAHHLQQDHEVDESIEVHSHEEDKEQCSPVSVLDPAFPDDKEGHDFGAEEDNGYNNLECIYANVQRAKHKLLQKLHRFEKLAKLDPIELEKRMSEQCDDDIQEEEATNGVDLSDILNVLNVKEIPIHMNRLISDLIVEETKNDAQCNVIVQRVRSRLESWKMVESNTIDMMVELDFRKERSQGWTTYGEPKIREIGMDIEMAIFGVLMEELTQTLVIS
uniref:uncharacterized protein LOC122604232 n=1 Tax=Erigeron canadensis TaxID=72917 RepID=UPI001CB9B15B|nr:uncharacterized protein LOC122604232 [Erigeron canadensis]